MSQNSTSFTIESQINQTRTVFDILWSCLFVIFACTWTVQHLNVPPQRDEETDPGWKGDVRYGLKNFCMSAKWMVITVLAPEILITLNTGQLASAMTTLKKLKQFAKEDDVSWSLTHSLFANMGGFVVREYAPAQGDVLSLLPARKTQAEADKVEVSGFERQSGEDIQADNDVSSDGKDGSTGNIEAQRYPKQTEFCLLAHEIMQLREQNVLKLPCITRDEIMDKAKSDNLGRIIAVAQVLWLVVQMIVRASRRLEVSQLEIGTLAFASCAVIVYALNWHKPKGVGVPLVLWSFADPIKMPQELSRLRELELRNKGWVGSTFEGTVEWTPKDRASSIPNHHRNALGLMDEADSLRSADDHFVDFMEDCFLVFISIVFGAIHFAALHSIFPNPTEKIVWCVASAVCTGLAVINPLLVEILLIVERFGILLSWWDQKFVRVFYGFEVVLYILARLFLIVELFRTLFFLPPSAFVATWVSSVPHVS